MKLRQLTYFIAVAEELSFRGAAERLNVSQPPLSVQIRDLERELGVRLFVRSTQKVALTSEGEVFLRRARAIIKNIEDTRQEMAAMAGSGGVLQIGYMSSAMLYSLVPVLAKLRERSELFTLGLHQMPPDEQLRAIARGALDAGFVDFGAGKERIGVDDQTLVLETIWREPLAAALPPGHRFADEVQIAPEQLVTEPLIILARNPFFGFYDRVLEHLGDHSRRPVIAHEARDLPQVLALVAAGFGVTVAPERSSQSWRDRVRFVPIRPGIQTDVCLVYRADNTEPLLQRLRGAVPTWRGAEDDT